MTPFRSITPLAPMIKNYREAKASQQQYVQFTRLILKTYQAELTDGPEVPIGNDAFRMVKKLLQTQTEEQALKGFAQRLLLIIYSAREWRREHPDRKIPGAEVWFNPRKANNILAMEKEILALV